MLARQAALLLLPALTLALVAGASCSSSNPSDTTDASVPSVDASAADAQQPADADGAASADAARDAPIDASADAPVPPAMAPCPTTGRGAITLPPGATCVALTPAATGADPAGANAGDPHYALVPAGAGSGALVLFFNGSGGSPAGAIGDLEKNVYTAALAEGHHVLALSYRSDDAIGRLCPDDDPCFLPTRTAIVTGKPQAGAAAAVASIGLTEGIYARTTLALRGLARGASTASFAQFVTGAADFGEAIVWSRVIVAGHSQGGGHAALLGRLNAVRRIVPLSSPCDSVGETPATWLTYDPTTWKTNPATAAYVFSALTTFGPGGRPTGGDTICSAHAAAWRAMGVDPSRAFDDAFVCGSSPHAATLGCVENFDRLREVFR